MYPTHICYSMASSKSFKCEGDFGIFITFLPLLCICSFFSFVFLNYWLRVSDADTARHGWSVAQHYCSIQQAASQFSPMTRNKSVSCLGIRGGNRPHCPQPDTAHLVPAARLLLCPRLSLLPKQSSRHSDFLLDKQTAAALSRALRLITWRSW